jgi:hypothetical protein
MGQEFLDIVLGQDASATSCGTGILPVDPCKEKRAVSKRSSNSGLGVLRCLRPRNQLKGGVSPGDSPWRVLTPPPHRCRPLTPACLQPQREDVI